LTFKDLKSISHRGILESHDVAQIPRKIWDMSVDIVESNDYSNLPSFLVLISKLKTHLSFAPYIVKSIDELELFLPELCKGNFLPLAEFSKWFGRGLLYLSIRKST
jgi:hypothetical protein